MQEARKGLTTPQQLEEMKRELAEAANPASAANKKRKRVYKYFLNLLFLIILLCLFFVLYQIINVKRTGEAPNIFGYYLYNIETESMSPTLPVGSVILSHSLSDPSKLEAGDIVTFINLDGERVTHRIVQVSKDVDGKPIFRTKGDNPVNDMDKDFLTPDRIESVFILKVPVF